MFRFYRDGLEVLVQTQDRVAFEERPHFVAGLLFLVFGIMMIVVTLRQRPSGQTAIVVSILVGTSFCLLGLLGLVRTTISVVKQPGVLEIRRQLGPILADRRYPLAEVVRVVERKNSQRERAQGRIFGSASEESYTLDGIRLAH